MRAAACCSCSYFKAVVQVRLAPTEQLKQALQRVRHQEDRAPKFVLCDMHSFMLAQRGLLLRIARDDDMAECDRRKRQESYRSLKHRAARRKADLQYATNAFDLCPDQAHNASCADAYGRGWRGPDIFECGSGRHDGFVRFMPHRYGKLFRSGAAEAVREEEIVDFDTSNRRYADQKRFDHL